MFVCSTCQHELVERGGALVCRAKNCRNIGLAPALRLVVAAFILGFERGDNFIVHQLSGIGWQVGPSQRAAGVLPFQLYRRILPFAIVRLSGEPIEIYNMPELDEE